MVGHRLNLNLLTPQVGDKANGLLDQLRVIMRWHTLDLNMIKIQVGVLESIVSDPTIFVGVHGIYPNDDEGYEMKPEPLLVNVPVFVCRVEWETDGVIFLDTGHYLMSMADGSVVQPNGLPANTRFLVHWEMNSDCSVVEYTVPNIIAIPVAAAISETAEHTDHTAVEVHPDNDKFPESAINSPRTVTLRVTERKDDLSTTDLSGSAELPDGIEAHQVTFDAGAKIVSLKTLRPTPATT